MRPSGRTPIKLLSVEVPIPLMDRLDAAKDRDGGRTLAPTVRRLLTRALAWDERQAEAPPAGR